MAQRSLSSRQYMGSFYLQHWSGCRIRGLPKPTARESTLKTPFSRHKTIAETVIAVITVTAQPCKVPSKFLGAAKPPTPLKVEATGGCLALQQHLSGFPALFILLALFGQRGGR